MGVNLKKISKSGYFKKLDKSQNKVVVAEQIGWGNDVLLSKIGREIELRQK